MRQRERSKNEINEITLPDTSKWSRHYRRRKSKAQAKNKTIAIERTPPYDIHVSLLQPRKSCHRQDG